MSSDHSDVAKAQLRAELNAARAERARGLTVDERIDAASQLAAAVLAEPLVTAALGRGQTVASYLPLSSEPDTTELNAALLERGIRVLVPKCVKDDNGEPTLAWIELTAGISESHVLTNDERGIPVPDGTQVGVGLKGLVNNDCSLIFVPALAATRSGDRMGKGAGYYDRLLSKTDDFDTQPLTAAIVFANELLDSLPTEAHDAPVDVVITV